MTGPARPGPLTDADCPGEAAPEGGRPGGRPLLVERGDGRPHGTGHGAGGPAQPAVTVRLPVTGATQGQAGSQRHMGHTTVHGVTNCQKRIRCGEGSTPAYLGSEQTNGVTSGYKAEHGSHRIVISHDTLIFPHGPKLDSGTRDTPWAKHQPRGACRRREVTSPSSEPRLVTETQCQGRALSRSW